LGAALLFQLNIKENSRLKTKIIKPGVYINFITQRRKGAKEAQRITVFPGNFYNFPLRVLCVLASLREIFQAAVPR
jgi:hypothetical protein